MAEHFPVVQNPRGTQLRILVENRGSSAVGHAQQPRAFPTQRHAVRQIRGIPAGLLEDERVDALLEMIPAGKVHIGEVGELGIAGNGVDQ